MCLAIPGKVLEIMNDTEGVRMARTNFGGVVKQICLAYMPEVQVGDYVLVHVGVAIGKVDEEEAERTYKALEELGQLEELEPPDIEALARERGSPT
jgi:hydrogenase expression/formation protein HypC